MKRPYILLGALSILLSFVSLLCDAAILLLSLALILLAFLVCFCIKGNAFFKNPNNAIILIVSILLLASCLFSVLCLYNPTVTLAGTTANFEGTVIREPEHRGEWTVYTLSGRHSMLKGNFKCRIVCDEDYNIGDRLNITATFKLDDEEYRNNNLSNGVFLLASLKSVNRVDYGYSKFYKTLGRFRKYIKEQIYSVCDGDIGGVMLALLTGNRDFISDSLYSKTKVCGVTHVMVVSGLHVGILSGILLKLLTKLKVKRRLSVFICFVFFLLLIALCDFHTSAVRSVVMSSVMLMGSIISRRADPLNSLGFAVTVMTLTNPFIAGSPSFLLSVFATFGVIYLSPMLQYLLSFLKTKGRFSVILNGTIDIIIVSVSAVISILPISTYYFGCISPLSPIVTVLIGLAVEISLVLAALGTVLSVIPLINLISTPLFYLSGNSTRYINSVIDFFGNFKNLMINIDPKLANFTFIFSSLLIFTVLLLYNNKKQKERKNDNAAEREGS